MYEYSLEYCDVDGKTEIKLFSLGEPAKDKEHFREYTDKEIEKHNKETNFNFWKLKLGDGEYYPSAFLPRNREKKDIGELPHQWACIYSHCSNKRCNKLFDIEIKFTDGLVKEMRIKKIYES